MKNYLLIIATLCTIHLYSQRDSTDPAYKNPANQNYSGNVKETGVNSQQIIDKKLKKADKETDKIKNPDGWNNLLKQAQIKQENENAEQSKKDSIQKHLEYKGKLLLIEKQKDENFKNKMLGYLIGLIFLILIVVIVKKVFGVSRDRLKLKSLFSLQKISQRELLFISLSIGVLISVFSGSLFYKIRYYKLYKNSSIEVSKDISTFELHEFNYLVAIVCFIVFTGISYLYLRNKRKEIS